MKKTEKLQLVSLNKLNKFYSGEVIMLFDAVKCMYGSHVKFRQKKIPKELLKYEGKDISKWKSSIYVNCELQKIETISSSITEGGEEYEVSTGTTDASRVKIISFDSLNYTKDFMKDIFK